MTPRSFSFRGCRTKAEALGRYDAWITALLQEQLLKFQRDILAAMERGEIVDDSGLNAIDEAEQTYNQERLRLLQQTSDFLSDALPDSAVIH